MEPRLHADAVGGDVGRAAAERQRPEHPDSRQHQRDCGADAGGSGGGIHGEGTGPGPGGAADRPPRPVRGRVTGTTVRPTVSKLGRRSGGAGRCRR